MNWTEERPWGRFLNLLDTEDYKVKLLEINPNARLSYQSHEKRSETITGLKGKVEIILDGKTLSLEPGETLFIPQGAKHRYTNPGNESVQLVEVQTGTYFGEDDIKRYEDDFGRIPL